MPDDSRLAIRLLTLGVALLAFGLGCHFWADRVYRTAGLAIGAVQLCRYFLDKRIQDCEPEQRDRDADAMDEELRSPHGCSTGDGGYACDCNRIDVTQLRVSESRLRVKRFSCRRPALEAIPTP